VSTLEMVSASHAYTFTLKDRIATWNFSKINLADSTTNEAMSHGYILFNVKPVKGLNVGEIFKNRAAIYFDYNLPEATNIVTVNLNNTGQTLPIIIGSFTAALKNNVVRLDWRTVSEIKSGFFIIERSTNAVNFDSVGTKKAFGIVNGSAYDFTDGYPVNGTNYYRLKMVDKDGQFTYSPVVIIYYNTHSWSASVSPNPNNGRFIVKLFNGLNDASLKITGIDGKVVYNKMFNGSTTIQVHLPMLSVGLYVITIENNKQKFNQKILVQ
ncbi:MAG TPA: T9SS type A sorting domain-containing protein, partial [Segetibacter sp.]